MPKSVSRAVGWTGIVGLWFVLYALFYLVDSVVGFVLVVFGWTKFLFFDTWKIYKIFYWRKYIFDMVAGLAHH